MKRGTNWFLPALVAMISVAGLLGGACGGLFGVGFTFDSHQNAPFGVLLFLTACAVATGAVMGIRWIAKWKRTPAGKAVDLRLLWTSLALVAGGFILMVVAISNLKIDFK